MPNVILSLHVLFQDESKHSNIARNGMNKKSEHGGDTRAKIDTNTAIVTYIVEDKEDKEEKEEHDETEEVLYLY